MFYMKMQIYSLGRYKNTLDDQKNYNTQVPVNAKQKWYH